MTQSPVQIWEAAYPSRFRCPNDILAIVEELEGGTVQEIAARVEFDEEGAEHGVDKLKERGRIYSMEDELRIA